MSEPAEVRLVRCPKCQNLLPELADYSVYQCGGCGAVLRAKAKKSEADSLSQKAEEDMVRGVFENFPEKTDNYKISEKVMSLSDGSENEAKTNGNSSRRADKRGKVLDNIADNRRNGSSIRADDWVADNDLEVIENLSESGHSEKEKKSEDSKTLNGIGNGYGRSGLVADRRNPEREFHGMRYSTTEYSEDGPSNYNLRSNYGYGQPVKYQNKTGEFNKAEYLEQDRAELLRKLDELKDQLSRSCDVKDKPEEKVPLDQRLVRHNEPYSGGSETRFPTASWGSNKSSSQYSMPDPFIARPSYVSHYPDQPPYMKRHEMDRHRFYPSMPTSNPVHRFGDPLRSQMLRRAPPEASSALQQHKSHPYFSEQPVANDMAPFEPYLPNMSLHHPSCSCFYCYNKHPQVPAPAPLIRNSRFAYVPNNTMYYHCENPDSYGTRDNPTMDNPQLNFHHPQSHTRWTNDLNSEAGSFLYRRPSKVVLPTGGRRCHPIAGGAPFVTCYNCFQLLQLPKKILLMEKNQKKVRCGDCSSVILFAVIDKKLVISMHDEIKRTPKMVNDSPNVTVNSDTSHSRVYAERARMNFASYDYENFGYEFQAMDREVNQSSSEKPFSSRKSAEMRSVHSTSSYSSDDEAKHDNLNTQRLEFNSADVAATSNQSPAPAGSPLQDHFEYSNNNHVANRFAKGNQSGRSEWDKGEPKKVSSRQNSMKDASLATEMEVSFNEYSNTGTSQESGEASREEDQPRVNKRGQSFFAGIIKKSFRDFSSSSQTIEASSTNVTVNGHPIPDRFLKKAEKLAGTIHPGQYWYDSRAGFWGVMGGPCMGIIPPFIEEFNYPMPENCAGGNTDVFVNGRELHQKDLNLLSSRGLPTTRDRSYIIEISGRVLDEDSREELDSLGKLAPTVEKAKRGFGMKVPRVAA